jgi:nodulation protein E
MMACIGAIKDNVVPPTINYQTPDPECNLDVTPNESRERQVKAVLTNAFAFGGLNSVLALTRFEG